MPGFNHFPLLYGEEYPETPANAAPTGATHPTTTAGTMFPAQLQESTQTNGPPPGLARAREIVSSDITRLATTDPIGEVELQQMYKKMLQNIFQANLESLSIDMIRATFDLAENSTNRSTLHQYWHNDWDWASRLLKDDKVIRSHCQHRNWGVFIPSHRWQGTSNRIHVDIPRGSATQVVNV